MLDSTGSPVEDQRFSTNSNNRELIFRFDGLPDDTYYWSLPSRFLGDKVINYMNFYQHTYQYVLRTEF